MEMAPDGTMPRPNNLDLRPTGEALGVEVRGIDLSAALDDGTFQSLHAAWLEHLVLWFRDQVLSPAQLATFGARFGELDMVPGWREYHAEGEPMVLVISNVEEDGRSIGVLGYGESVWHTDMSYLETPPKASALYALEVPETGGNTSFINMYAALAALPQDLRSAVEGRLLNHDSSYDSTGSLRPGASDVVDVSRAPGARHPIIRRHPDTARPALYLGRRQNAYIVGLDVADSDAALDRVWANVCRPELVWEHSWRPGDLLLWDNRCTMHRRDPFDPADRRVMHRAQIKGDRPEGDRRSGLSTPGSPAA